MENYQFSAAELEYLQKWFEQEEIDQAERVVYSYEDWLDPNRSMGFFIGGKADISAHYLTEDGSSTTKGNGQLTVFVLPDSEGRKIERRKNEIVEGFTQAYFLALTNWFESQYEKSLEKEIFVKREIEKVEKLLFEWKADYQYKTYGEGLWLSFHTYANHKKGTMCDWYEHFCINGEDAKGAVSGHHATMTANQLNSHHPETLHFVVAALAFRQFKDYLSKRLPIQLTFEDWQSGNWPEWAERLTGTYTGMHRDADGDYRYYSLSNNEYQKIAAAQNAIFETQVDLSLQRLISDFEQRFSKSRATEILLKTELQKVNQWMTDKDFGGPCRLPNPNGGITDFSDLMGLRRGKGENANQFPYWFNELIVQGGEAFTYIEAKHERMQMLIYPIALHVLYQYELFLKNRMTTTAEPLVREAEKPKIKKKALEYLSILGGRNMHGRTIMEDADYQRVRGYVEAMIEKGGLPDGLEPVSQVDLPNGHIRYLFRSIHAEQYAARKIHDYFIDFLHTIFPQFTGNKETTKHKFGEQPTTWKADFEKMKGG